MKKNGIIPVNQAGFRKGRCTTDHLVKLTSHIKKKQFSSRKSTLATFVDVKKAYDSVWHARLLYKLKNIGITGMKFQYFKNFLSERCICTRVGQTYSSNKTIDMGIPQGSVIAPILFNIIIHDLPKVLSNNTHVAQYADDTAIWANTTLRKHTNKMVVNHVQKSQIVAWLVRWSRKVRACVREGRQSHQRYPGKTILLPWSESAVL